MSGRVGEGQTVSHMRHAFAPSPHTPSPHILHADAVQLTLLAPRSPFQPPRLAPFVGQRYAPTGRLHVSPLTPGMMLDIYV
jgi:hypothetical protein